MVLRLWVGPVESCDLFGAASLQSYNVDGFSFGEGGGTLNCSAFGLKSEGSRGKRCGIRLAN